MPPQGQGQFSMNLREGLAALLFLMLVICLLGAWGFYLDKTIYVWDLPTPGPSIPKWLADIAEGIAGQRLTTKGTFQPVTGDTFFDILNEIAKSDPAWREPWMR